MTISLSGRLKTILQLWQFSDILRVVGCWIVAIVTKRENSVTGRDSLQAPGKTRFCHINTEQTVQILKHVQRFTFLLTQELQADHIPGWYRLYTNGKPNEDFVQSKSFCWSERKVNHLISWPLRGWGERKTWQKTQFKKALSKIWSLATIFLHCWCCHLSWNREFSRIFKA